MRWTGAFAVVLLAGLPAAADIRFSELMYHPVAGERFEFIELVNDGEATVDVGGWSIGNAVELTIAEGTTIDAGATALVCRSREDFLAAYPEIDAALVVGEYTGRLDNGGERVVLLDAGGTEREVVRYDDNPPWDFLADGFGASLERLCLTADPDLAENWRASPVPADPETEFGGTPGALRAEMICPPEPPARPPVFLSEIHYHAVLEEAIEDEYEYLEIHNAGETPVDLAGWRIAGGIDFAFPDETTIAAGAYLIVARDPEKLLAVPGYDLDARDVFGPYERTLDNGGEKLAIVSAAGQGIDSVSYDDDAPWPHAADALGAGASWLPEELLPLEDHRHKGRSLERVSFDVPAGEVANWAPSPLDGMTPGRPNASARAEPLAITRDIDVTSAATGSDTIRADEPVRVDFEFSPFDPSSITVEWFLEDIESDDEATASLPATLADGEFAVEIPGLPDNSIVRYRIRGDRGAGDEVISPRPSDPFDWHSYFVEPVIETDTRVYHVFISRAAWGQLNRNMSPFSRVLGCAVNPAWNARERAIVVSNGQVSPASVRYQGSRWNRFNGPTLAWGHPGPSVGGVKGLSWRIAVPRYAQIRGIGVIVLNKLTQGCPGHNAGVGYRLFEQADVPAPQTAYARLHINGGYYRYMMEYERPGEEMMRRYHREQAEKYPDRPREKVGHLFKSVGCTCDEGPYGWGDWRLLGAFCGHTKEVRYAWTYDRKTHEWADNAAFVKLVEDMHAARAGGVDAMRDYLLENYDLDLLLNYIAIINWSVPFDDMFQNHFIYQRVSDGKWLLAPWDLDRNFGEWQGANSSLLIGKQGDPSNRSGWWHRLKDTVFRAFEDEYLQRMLYLNNTLLHPDNVAPLVDGVTASSNQAEANAAPAGLSCGTFAGRDASFRSYALQRHNFVNAQLAPGVGADAGADLTVFVGETARFDATGSGPPPGPDVEYVWDNGMAGAAPTFVFDTPGEYEITLTIEALGVPFRDSVQVTVLEPPAEGFAFTGGELSIEAESFFDNERREHPDTWWVESTDFAGFSGTSYMHAFEERRRTISTAYSRVAPELRYAVQFPQPGTYYVWMRSYVPSTRGDTVNISVDGRERASREATDFEVDETAFIWGGLDRNDERQVLVVDEPGLRVVSVWIRESGFNFDKLVLTQNEAYVPEGVGPDESPRVPTGGEGFFVRGDVNGDRSLNVTDAIRILHHLFGGQIALDCEDHGDIDDNGSLQITDAIRLLDYLFARGEAPAPPFPIAGLDTTPDEYPCGDGAP